jgi:hypothetical protein
VFIIYDVYCCLLKNVSCYVYDVFNVINSNLIKLSVQNIFNKLSVRLQHVDFLWSLQIFLPSLLCFFGTTLRNI